MSDFYRVINAALSPDELEKNLNAARDAGYKVSAVVPGFKMTGTDAAPKVILEKVSP